MKSNRSILFGVTKGYTGYLMKEFELIKMV